MTECRIELGKGLFALVDEADYALVSSHKWYASKERNNYYARTALRLRMHRLVLGLKRGDLHVDHRNGNTLDNRRANLRVATIAENNRNVGPTWRNKSGYRGVHPTRNKVVRWIATVNQDGEKVYLGTFDTPLEAARVYNAKTKELYGDFAWLNPLPDQESN